ncbi:hypothetical protein CNE_2c02630 [Cupriavidus necator N-1]|uniref:Uncharacterized protein n=1 Tax=Cupriavidus necator (strain ATCC 43291 / DSM 13513 / CCUG 52238 / LMG 8453 / N-1) TaxID=1042878 RepID=F8GPG7_CUPNN|nr:hypothetical protein CNE_2c02630 [Cupriavidus necator N-1]
MAFAVEDALYYLLVFFTFSFGKADGASGSETKEVGATVPGVAVALVLSVAWTWVA